LILAGSDLGYGGKRDSYSKKEKKIQTHNFFLRIPRVFCMLWCRMLFTRTNIVHVNEDCDAKNKATYDAKKYREKEYKLRG
jgi:hypothetical protein